MMDRFDLGPASYRGPVEKPRTEGGVGKKKPNRKRASPARVAEVREKKLADGCRVCLARHNLHAHHLVKRGAPWFGQWTENCIVALCGDCHRDLHDNNTARAEDVRKVLRFRLTAAEVQYADDRAYPGYVDETIWPLRELGANPGTLKETA